MSERVCAFSGRGGEAWERAVGHPMVKEIAAGTLPHDLPLLFEQNILYLEEYARAIAQVIATAPDHDATAVLVRFLTQIVASEIPANHD